MNAGQNLGRGSSAKTSPEVIVEAQEKRRDGEHHTGQDPGTNACCKEGRHCGRRHQNTVDDECHGRRDQDIRGACGCGHAGRKAGWIARPDHGPEHYTSHRGCARGSGAGDAADDHGHEDGDDREGAPALTHDSRGES